MSRTYVTGKRLGFFNTDVWFQDHMGQVIGNAAGALPLEAPVEGHTNLVNDTSINAQRAHTPRHHCSRFDLSARSADNQPLAMFDLAFLSQFGTKLDEEGRLQRVEPGHPA